MTAAQIEQVLLGNTGTTYEGAIDLDALRAAHLPRYREQTMLTVDGNTAAAIPFLQWWRAPIIAGFPITPSTKWIEHIAAEVGAGKFDVEIGGRKIRAKRIKLLESEHTVADYMAGVAAACRGLIVGTATSSVGLDHMTETVRSLGASGLGNVMIVNVCRATANYPLCIEGDPSDTFAHRDDGFIQVCCRGKQQIYDTILQLPALGGCTPTCSLRPCRCSTESRTVIARAVSSSSPTTRSTRSSTISSVKPVWPRVRNIPIF